MCVGACECSCNHALHRVRASALRVAQLCNEKLHDPLAAEAARPLRLKQVRASAQLPIPPECGGPGRAPRASPGEAARPLPLPGGSVAKCGG